MKTLITVELRRLFSRRLFKVLTALVVAAFAVIGTISFVTSDDSPERVAQAQAQHKADIANCMERAEVAASQEPAPEVQDIEQLCRDENYGSDPRFRYADMPWIVGTLSVPLMMLGWLLGASFIGAEWKDRTITTTLTWERRRVRVLAAKAIALSIVAFGWVLLLQAFFIGAMYPAGALEGSMAGVDGQWWMDTWMLVLRSAGLAAMAGLFGFSLAAIGRNTAAALGIGFVYLAVIEGMVRGFKPSWAGWLIGDNAVLVLFGDLEGDPLGHSGAAAASLLAVYSAGIFALAVAFFRRRDIA